MREERRGRKGGERKDEGGRKEMEGDMRGRGSKEER